MKMKKLGALLLAGAMTMSTLLTGCGNGASGSSAGGNASQTESGSNGEKENHNSREPVKHQQSTSS
ncbi:MAG: hypothetical protein ACLTVV_08400 [Ruminococcus sp.]